MTKVNDRLRNARENIRHNLDLYLTIVVCGFLLVLKVFHVVEDHWIHSSILVTLMLLAIGNLRDRTNDKALIRTLEGITSQGSADEAIRWYTLRSDATTDMLKDMEEFKHLGYLGISHRQLSSYLDDRLRHAEGRLPWESIEVYFASPALGEAYEGAAFSQNLMRARQEIAALLTDPAFAERLPHLRSVEFFQQNGFATHTGAMIGATARELAVIYAVHSAVHLHGNTHQGLTVRLSATPGRGFKDPKFEHYDAIYRAVNQSSVRLGEFARSVWDESALRWSEYARQSDVLRQSAAAVADMISLQPGDSVLDIGTGSGESAEAILRQNADASITLLDGSPQMIRILRDRFQHERRVKLALCQLPSADGSSIDLGDTKFSYIVIHQTLGELGRSFGRLDEVARWCRGRLRPNGKLLVTAHNTLVATPTNGWDNWRDPFRSKLTREIEKKVAKKAIRDLRTPIEEKEVVGPFGLGGFAVESRVCKVIDVSWEERRRLWKVPAVMDSVVETTAISMTDRDQFVDRIVDELKMNITMPRTVIIWQFSPVDSRGTESSLPMSKAD